MAMKDLGVAGDEVRASPERSLNTEPQTSPEDAGPPRLTIIGATWGGVNVTADVQGMVSTEQTVDFDMRTVHQILQPDPVPQIVKVLTVLYQYEGEGSVYLLNAQENVNFLGLMGNGDLIQIRPNANTNLVTRSMFTMPSTSATVLQKLEKPWCAENGGVEILAVTYGPQQIETPSVLEELGKFFEGRRGQIRMTSAFFKGDTWPSNKKSWSVFFRFVGSQKVQCVTGLQDGALEVPWGRF
jgi:hypothetical protein